MIRWLVSPLVALGLTLLSPGGVRVGTAFAQTTPGQAAVALLRLDTVLAAFEELRATIDRSQFDVSALALDLAFEDADFITGFVRDHIYFEQYPGVLRGPAGTLMSRAGNAFDQALLLARLLGDAGYEARIATGRIDEATAKLLLRQMMQPRAEPPPFADYQAFTAVLTGLEASTAVPAGTYTKLFQWSLTDSTHSEFEAEVEADAAAVVAALTEAGATLGDEEWLPKLVEEAQAYAWVEYRLRESDAWQQAHPAFHEAAAVPADLVSASNFSDSVPAELVHSLRVESVIERRLGDGVSEVPIMDAWERPVPNLVGVPVSYSNMPEAMVNVTDLSAIDMDQIAADSTLFFPIFMGSPASGAQAFDLLGNSAPAAEAASPMAAVFRSAGAAMGAAATALGGLGQPQGDSVDAVALVSQTLRFTFIAPDGTETAYERALEPVPNDVGASARALSTESTFMVAAGTLSDGFVVDRMLQRVIMTGPLWEVSLQKSVDLEAEIVISTQGLDASDMAWLGHLLIYQAFDSEPQLVPESLSYRSAPTLVIRHVATVPTADSVEVIDVVTNPRRSYSWATGQLQSDTLRTVRRGVWETHAEGVISATESRDAFTTMAAMHEADGSRREVTVLFPDQAELADALAPDAISAANMRRDLVAGYAIVVPADAPVNERTGWWRVDAASGETLGIVSDGRGGVLTEYLAVSTIASFGTVLTCFAVADRIGGGVRGAAWDCLGAGVGVGLFFMVPEMGLGMVLELLFSLALGFLDVGSFDFPF